MDSFGRISVIVPIYNVAPFLKTCLDSLVQQSYAPFEVLLINDGSTDESGSLCDQYAANHAHFRVIHQPNAGVSSARNCGLTAAQGEYICFVDSDDAVNKDFCKHFIDGYQIQPVDVVCCGYEWKNQLFKLCNKPIVLGPSPPIQIIHYLKARNSFGYVWNKCYKRSIIENHQIFFPTGVDFNEDMFFNFNYFQHISSAALSEHCSYRYYDENAASITKQHVTVNQHLARFKKLVPLIIKADNYSDSRYCAEVLALDFEHTKALLKCLCELDSRDERMHVWHFIADFYHRHPAKRLFVKRKQQLLYYAIKSLPLPLLDSFYQYRKWRKSIKQ